MVERFLGPVAGHRALFVVLAVALFFVRLLPLHSSNGGWPGPDFLLCLVCCWTLRRPDYLPFWLIAAVIFLEDLLMMRPPGLWAVLVVGGAEFLRGRIAIARELNFGVEWLLVSLVIAAIFLLNRIVFTLTLLPQIPFETLVVHLIVTVLTYPLVVGTSILAFGLRKPAMGEVDSTGRRI